MKFRKVQGKSENIEESQDAFNIDSIELLNEKSHHIHFIMQIQLDSIYTNIN